MRDLKEKDPLGARLKGNYEDRQRYYLQRRTPVILRLDGKSCSKYTRPLKDRFHPGFIEVMNLAAIKLCEEIQGAQLALVQSDEVSILIHDYKKLTSEAWFDYCISKMESVAASIASTTFTMQSWRIWSPTGSASLEYIKPLYFDARARNYPEAEVCNSLLWRQRDAIKNSILSLAQTVVGHSDMQHKNCSELQELCFQAGYNWNNLPTYQKRGRCIVKTTYEVDGAQRTKWVVDNEIPEFSQDRNYIEKYLATEE